MKGIAVLLSALILVAGGFLTGCATREGAVATVADLPRFPFPQHAFDQFAIAPMMPTVKTQAEMDDMVIALFREIIRNDLIVDSSGPQTREGFRMVLRHFQAGEVAYGILDVSHIATSESHGYGMLIMAYMAGSEDRLGLSQAEWLFGSTSLKDYFDAMLRTVVAFSSNMGSSLFALRLLGYQDINQAGVTQGGYRLVNGVKTAPFTRDAVHGNSTTGGNMDIIYSLILADRQWGSNGRYDYISIARTMLADLWIHCVHEQYHFLLLGDWVNVFGSSIHRSTARTSDFMISHLKAFRDVDPAHNWQAVIDASHNAIREIRGAQNALGNRNGLLPDFIVRGATGWEIPPGNIIESDDDAFAYNAVRVPWRLGTAFMLFGNAMIGDATLYEYIIRPLDDFARAFTGGGNLSRFGPLNMNGTPLFDWTYPNLFAPPFAVTAAAVGADRQWVDAFWRYTPANEWAFQGLGSYQGDTYGDYIRLIVLLTVSGNYWIP
ncbi:MAG: glycosyl hydrolase family 8 [Treponema sp.]|nr:glycosyl hydrolase family 8 [Treponema sp.]